MQQIDIAVNSNIAVSIKKEEAWIRAAARTMLSILLARVQFFLFFLKGTVLYLLTEYMRTSKKC